MPDVIGKKLDAAKSEIQRAGVDDDVEVQGGGAFGIVKESNWEVCDQSPAAGKVVTQAPRLTVDRSCETASDNPGPSASSAGDSGKTGPTTADPGLPYDGSAKYGTVAKATVRLSTGTSIPLKVTVSAPKAFTPSDPADATQSDSVYFVVTIKNDSKSDSFKADAVVTSAISGLGADPSVDDIAGEGTDGDWIDDLDAGITGIDGAPEIRPGKSITFKDGFSVASAADVTYKIRPAGLASGTLYFQK